MVVPQVVVPQVVVQSRAKGEVAQAQGATTFRPSSDRGAHVAACLSAPAPTERTGGSAWGTAKHTRTHTRTHAPPTRANPFKGRRGACVHTGCCSTRPSGTPGPRMKNGMRMSVSYGWRLQAPRQCWPMWKPWSEVNRKYVLPTAPYLAGAAQPNPSGGEFHEFDFACLSARTMQPHGAYV